MEATLHDRGAPRWRDAMLPGRAITSHTAPAAGPHTPPPPPVAAGMDAAPLRPAPAPGVARHLLRLHRPAVRRQLWEREADDPPLLPTLDSVWATSPAQREVNVLDLRTEGGAMDSTAAAVAAVVPTAAPPPTISAKDRWLQERNRRQLQAPAEPPSSKRSAAEVLDDLLTPAAKAKRAHAPPRLPMWSPAADAAAAAAALDNPDDPIHDISLLADMVVPRT